EYADILVETSNRFQGLERPIMLVHHPLSGRADAKEFHLDAGRLCVMLSRHTVACFVFARAGLEKLLGQEPPRADRTLGLEADPLFEGWKSHQHVIHSLRIKSRIFAF
ncbi:MAG: helicase, partial [Planctomycetota bacterium]|nr:helicase [Planctomycetota bacterium]